MTPAALSCLVDQVAALDTGSLAAREAEAVVAGASAGSAVEQPGPAGCSAAPRDTAARSATISGRLEGHPPVAETHGAPERQSARVTSQRAHLDRDEAVRQGVLSNGAHQAAAHPSTTGRGIDHRVGEEEGRRPIEERVELRRPDGNEPHQTVGLGHPHGSQCRRREPPIHHVLDRFSRVGLHPVPGIGPMTLCRQQPPQLEDRLAIGRHSTTDPGGEIVHRPSVVGPLLPTPPTSEM